MKNVITLITFAAAFAACSSAKQLNKTQMPATAEQTTAASNLTQVNDALNFVRKVNDNAVYATNINTRVDVTLNVDGKTFDVSGRLQMRQGEVIRITLTPFGLMEVGRLEFTPTYVLLVNRMDKQYVKASYSDVSFLKNNNIDFNMLQAIFWNKLFQPGKQNLADSDLSAFNVNFDSNAANTLTFTNGKLNCQWQADQNSARIMTAAVTYGKDTKDEATVQMNYDGFTQLGVKQFPANEKISFTAKSLAGKQFTLSLKMNGISTDADWDALTNVSDKYTQISADTFLSKLSAF